MPINRRLLKQEARSAMRAARPGALFMTLMYLLLTNCLNLVVGLFVDNPVYQIQALIQAGLDPWRSVLLALGQTGMIALFVHILLLLYGFVMDFGYRRWALRVSRGEECAVSDLVAGFGMPGRTVVLGLLTTLLYILWYLAAFLPALMLLVIFLMLLSYVGTIFVLPVLVGAAILFLLKTSQYALAPCCLAASPQEGPLAAIRRSRVLMLGRCGSYLVLMLSFLGWYLLSVLLNLAAQGVVLLCTVGAGTLLAAAAGDPAALAAFSAALGDPLLSVASLAAQLPLALWLTPYVALAGARFYEAVRPLAAGGPVHYRYDG